MKLEFHVEDHKREIEPLYEPFVLGGGSVFRRNFVTFPWNNTELFGVRKTDVKRKRLPFEFQMSFVTLLVELR